MVETKQKNNKQQGKEKNSQIRVRVPDSTKERLEALAEAKGVRMNVVVTILINEIERLGRKPNINSLLESAISTARLEKELMPTYHQLCANYSILKSTKVETSDTKFLDRCSDFKASAEKFVQIFNSAK